MNTFVNPIVGIFLAVLALDNAFSSELPLPAQHLPLSATRSVLKRFRRSQADQITCVPTTANNPSCHLCVDVTWSSVACQGSSQLLCHKKTDKVSCLQNPRCTWFSGHGGACEDINDQKCPTTVSGLQRCLDYDTNNWKKSTDCDAMKQQCESCSGGGCTTVPVSSSSSSASSSSSSSASSGAGSSSSSSASSGAGSSSSSSSAPSPPTPTPAPQPTPTSTPSPMPFPQPTPTPTPSPTPTTPAPTDGSSSSSGLSGGAIFGIVAGVVVVLAVAGIGVWIYLRKKRAKSEEALLQPGATDDKVLEW